MGRQSFRHDRSWDYCDQKASLPIVACNTENPSAQETGFCMLRRDSDLDKSELQCVHNRPVDSRRRQSTSIAPKPPEAQHILTGSGFGALPNIELSGWRQPAPSVEKSGL